MIDCKNCEGLGWYVVPDPKGNPVQEQCAHCNATGKVSEPLKIVKASAVVHMKKKKKESLIDSPFGFNLF